MLNIFTLDNGRLVSIRPDEIATRQPIWVDIVAPSDEERAWVVDTFSIGGSTFSVGSTFSIGTFSIGRTALTPAAYPQSPPRVTPSP